MADDERESFTRTLAQQLFGMSSALPGHNPPEPDAGDLIEAQVTPRPAPDSPSIENSPETSEAEARHKPLKTATELAEMIEFDLARHPDCPKTGFRVTSTAGPIGKRC
jgi:hypothetical protein